MSTAKMTSKGQLTVPSSVRRSLGLHSGSVVRFIPTDHGTYELVSATKSIRDLKGLFTWEGPPVSIEEMDAAIAQAAAEGLEEN